MPLPREASQIAGSLRAAAAGNKTGSARMKVRTLLHKFGLKRRTEENAVQITEALRQAGLEVEPSITKESGTWAVGFDGRVVLSAVGVATAQSRPEPASTTAPSPDGPLLALSIQQPFAEQVLQGTKTVEYRVLATRQIGVRFYIYASKTPGPIEEFEDMGLAPGDLPTGVLVGTAVITTCEGSNGDYEWHLADVERLARPRKPKNRGQPVWFRPF